jgi:alpha-1,2-mannosyltransferase
MSGASSSAPAAVSFWRHLWIPLYLSVRICLSNRMPVTDCDEVYNYWEPLHFMLYGQGQQTWEYANEYALRTFAYTVPLQGFATIWQYLIHMMAGSSGVSSEQLQVLLTGVPVDVDDTMSTDNDKLVLFWCLRATMGCLMAATEVYWLSTVHRHLRLSQTNLVVLATVLLTCTGMTHAAAAYVPSATWMGVWMLSTALFLQEQHSAFTVTAVMATLSTGWPFGAVCVVPMGLHILVKEFNQGRVVSFMSMVVAVTILTQSVVCAVDYQYYGRWVSPTWNIFAYNAGGSGDELYGIEPFSYYVKNLLLNCNLVAPLGVVALPIQLLSRKTFTSKDWNVVTVLSCLYVWFAITLPRPHKEERFLFPIYPVLCLGAVLTVDSMLNAMGRLEAVISRHKELAVRQRIGLNVVVWLPIVLLSISRSAALAKYYTAPLHIYTALAYQPVPVSGAAQEEEKQPLLACTCGEWYRFPSSFYLPEGVQLGFLPSVGFTGQLPQAFSEYGSTAPSRDVLQPFNDQNRQEMERYVAMSDCTWMIDLDGGECTPPANMNSRVLARAPFLDAEKTSALHRILYVPFLHERAVTNGQVHYQDYVLSVLE